ncbi:hypothetical protein ACFL2V_15745 [Pseudomonadota bacterium]
MKKLLLILMVGAVILSGCKEPVDGKYAELAQCLTEKGVVNYGAWWCHNCESQKKMFGDDFRYITYVECAEGGELTPDPKACAEAGVTAYPTWAFPGQENLVGVQTLEDIAKKANCELESDTEVTSAPE